jgi:hypothetical protein
MCAQGTAPAWAQASALSDLIGAKGASGETQLINRGYAHVDTHKHHGNAFSYWWSNRNNSCVRVTTNDGRYRAVVDVDASDCGQTKRETGMSDGAKVAIGAAALLGIAALAHKSHHRDDNNYNEEQTAEFERGYRDGLYHNGLHNYNNSREYSHGFDKGESERREQSGYRNGNGHGWGNWSWTSCAAEGGFCSFNGSGTVRYGAEGHFVTRRATNGLRCETRSFGDDPAYGRRKECWVRLDSR